MTGKNGYSYSTKRKVYCGTRPNEVSLLKDSEQGGRIPMAKSTRGLNCIKPTKVSGGRTDTNAGGVSSRKPWYTYPSEKYDFVSWDDDIPNMMGKS